MTLRPSRSIALILQGPPIDIVTQIAAVRTALGKAEEEIPRDRVAHCVEHAIESGDKDDQRQKITEIMEVLGRARR